MIKIENRASVVLYNFLKSNEFTKPFLLPANVCPIVPSVFLKAQIKFEFIDIDKSQAIDYNQVLELLNTTKYAGVLFVHSYGKTYNTDSLFQKIKLIDHTNCIIDDRCLCKPDTSLTFSKNSDLILYSTGYSKYVDLSKGGWGIINDNYKYISNPLTYYKNHYDEYMLQIKNCLIQNTKLVFADSNWLDTSHYDIDENIFFQTIEKALEKAIYHKKLLNNLYTNELPKKIQFPNEFNDWRFNIQVNYRAEILKSIFDANLFVGTNYPSISYIFGGKKSPKAEYMGKKVINLFNDFRFSEDQALKLCRIISKNL